MSKIAVLANVTLVDVLEAMPVQDVLVLTSIQSDAAPVLFVPHLQLIDFIAPGRYHIYGEESESGESLTLIIDAQSADTTNSCAVTPTIS